MSLDSPSRRPATLIADRAHVAETMVLATADLLPKLTLGGAAIYGGFAVLYGVEGHVVMALVTAISAVLFGVLAGIVPRRCSGLQAHFAIGVVVALVIANVTIEYAWSQRYLHGAGFALIVMAAGVLMPTLAWWLAFVAVSMVAWTTVTLISRIDIVVFEAVLALFAATAVGGLLMFMRVRMTGLAESLRLSLEATRDRELREILDSNADPMLLHRSGTIAYANPALAKLLATDAKALVGRRITDLTSQAELDRLAEVLEQRELSSVRSEGGLSVGPLPITLTRTDGTTVMLELAEPRTIWFEGSASIMWSGRDISASQQALHARLMAADRMAVAGSLASGLAHEINNPLTVVRLNLELLAAAPQDAPELITEIATSVARIEGIVSDLAAISPARADAIEDIALDRALQHAVTLASNEIRHRAEVTVETLATPSIRIARTKLTQAMVNLLLHLARQLEGKPGQRMIVRTCTAPDGRALVELVAPGLGLSSDAKTRMFDPFFTTNVDGFGGGLGLYYCHSVITGASGTVEIESTPRSGTTVRIAFPASKPGVEAAPKPPPSQPRVRVLVIDDEAAVGRAIKRLLANCEVEVSTSGAEGIARYKDLKPDLVLCDLMMPELSGPVVYETLRARFPEIDQHIVFMTGGVFTTKTQTFVDTTALPVLKKPVAVTQLRDLVARYARA